MLRLCKQTSSFLIFKFSFKIRNLIIISNTQIKYVNKIIKTINNLCFAIVRSDHLFQYNLRLRSLFDEFDMAGGFAEHSFLLFDLLF
jgi:hypothetical protein